MQRSRNRFSNPSVPLQVKIHIVDGQGSVPSNLESKYSCAASDILSASSTITTWNERRPADGTYQQRAEISLRRSTLQSCEPTCQTSALSSEASAYAIEVLPVPVAPLNSKPHGRGFLARLASIFFCFSKPTNSAIRAGLNSSVSGLGKSKPCCASIANNVAMLFSNRKIPMCDSNTN